MAQPEQQAAQAIADHLVGAWNSHDAKAFAAIFRPDADFTNVFGIQFPGRDGIERAHAQIFATMFRDSTLAFQAPRVVPLSPGLAWVALHWRMTGAYDPQGAPWPERYGVMHFVAAQDADAWSIAVLTNMDLPPPEKIALMQQALYERAPA